MESSELLQKSNYKPVQQKWLWTLFGILSFLSIVTLLMTIITVTILSLELGEVEVNEIPGNVYPSQFAIPSNRITPVKNVDAKGKSWIFSTIALIESSLRKEAIEKKIINENEYIALSEQAYGKLITQLCSDNNIQKNEEIVNFCNDVDIKNGANGDIEWIYYFRDYVKNYIYPEDVCEYQNDNEFKCDAVDASKIGENAIEMKVKSISSQYTPNSIKKMLNETQGPVGWGHSLLGRSYYYPCDENSPFNNNEHCVNKRYPCESGYCSKVVTHSYDNDGIFRLEGEPINRGDHSMIIVGWNDQYLNGGFILKNSMSTQTGHSIGYLKGEHSIFNENQICPTFKSIKQWIPLNRECFVEKKNVDVCPNIERKFVGKELKGATVLKCSDAEKAVNYGYAPCATEEGRAYNYALEMTHETEGSQYKPYIEFLKGSNGVGRFHLLRWKDGEEANVESVVTGYTTYQFMEEIFEPVRLNEYQNTEHCGYYFMSYEAFMQHQTKSMNGGHESYVFSSFDIEFNTDKLNIEKSKKEYKLPKFDGSLDF